MLSNSKYPLRSEKRNNRLSYTAIRFEGFHDYTSQTQPGNSNCMYECYFFENNVIELNFGNWYAPITGAVAGLYSANGTSLASYSPDANTGFVFVPNATATVYTVNTSNSYITGAVVTRQALDLGSAPATTWTPSGWNSLQNAYADDQNVSSNLHLNILFNNTSRGTVYIGSNFFITFGGGSNVTNPSSTNPALDKIIMNGGDRSYQRVGYKYGFK